MAQIQALAGKKTVILISHRLANVTAADNIYVLDHGSLAEQGTHEALLAAVSYTHLALFFCLGCEEGVLVAGLAFTSESLPQVFLCLAASPVSYTHLASR